MSILITSDLHLTDRQADDYRWGLFPWIEEQIDRWGIRSLCILGDITDQKDKHSAVLTNRIVDALSRLSGKLHDGIICLRGNHDYTEPSTPFFRFLNCLAGVKFVTEAYDTGLGSYNVLFLPNSRTPEEEWSKYDLAGEYDFIFMHQTFNGAESESGVQLNGVDTSILSGIKAKIISGDVHVPQKLGRVTYVGSPYRVHFGDKFKPRVLLLRDINEMSGNKEQIQDLHFKTTTRMTIELPDSQHFKDMEFDGDTQVKVRLKLSASDMLDWEKHKKEIIQACMDKGITLYQLELIRQEDLTQRVEAQEAVLKNLTPNQIFDEYCKLHKVDNRVKEYGLQVLSQAK